VREPWLVSLVYEPLADPLRTYKRFRAIVSSFGLPDSIANVSASLGQDGHR
jgi:hypothetical protein